MAGLWRLLTLAHHGVHHFRAPSSNVLVQLFFGYVRLSNTSLIRWPETGPYLMIRSCQPSRRP